MIRRELKKLLFEAKLVLEQEEGGDLFGGDEDEAADETEEDAGEEETPEEGEEEAEEEEAEEEDVTTDEEGYSLGKTVEDELDAVFVDYEEEAIQSAKEQQEKQVSVTVEESHKRSMTRILFESESIDLENFAQNIARLAKNYDSLLDMEKMILTKANDFIRQYYGEEQVQALEDILDTRYDLSLSSDEPVVAPIAVGAFGDPGGA